MLPSSNADANVVRRLRVSRTTALSSGSDVRAVILTPAEDEYRKLGQRLADAIEARCGVRLNVEDAADYVHDRPRVVRDDKLDRNFILLGQFWNNAVLERLYCKLQDPTDELYPGPGGYELRTVCAPFASGQNCIVATGSDIAGCKAAVKRLPDYVERDPRGFHFPFLHEVRLTGEAAQCESERAQRLEATLAELDRYAVFGHPQARTWTGEDPQDFLMWKDRNLSAAAVFGLYYWTSRDQRYADAFKRLVYGCIEHMGLLEKSYSEGRTDLMDYTGGELTIAWDLIEHTECFDDRERNRITNYLYRLAYLNDRLLRFICEKDTPLEQIAFGSRHQMGAAPWFWYFSDYLLRNCTLSSAQREMVEDWLARSGHYLDRVVQSPFYNDLPPMVHNEGEQVLRWALNAGNMEAVDNGCLRELADYWIAEADNYAFAPVGSRPEGWHPENVAGEVLNVAGWFYAKQGYQPYRRSVGRWPYVSFLFYMAALTGLGWNYYNFEAPPTPKDDIEKARMRASGLKLIPCGKGYYDQLTRLGPYSPDKYTVESIPYERVFKRLTIRGAAGPKDPYFVMQGMQGGNFSVDDANAIARFSDLGEQWLVQKSGWSTDVLYGRLGSNGLCVSSGRPGAKLSAMAELLTCVDTGSYALVRSRVRQHGGVAWTRSIFLKNGGWLLVVDETVPERSGKHCLMQTWLCPHPFQVCGGEAAAGAGSVTFHVVGDKDAEMVPVVEAGKPEGVRRRAFPELVRNRPFAIWTLLYAAGPDRPSSVGLRRIGPDCALICDRGKTGADAVVFTRRLELGDLLVEADMGVIERDRLTLAGCRSISAGDRSLLSRTKGMNLSVNLATDEPETVAKGFGSRRASAPKELAGHLQDLAQAAADCLNAAASSPDYTSPEVRGTVRASLPELSTSRLRLRVPVSLAHGDLRGDGSDELLMYTHDGESRFKVPEFKGEPVAVDFDGTGRRCIAFPAGDSVEVYDPDGRLRWRHAFSNTVYCLSAGDFNGDGREELGVGLNNLAAVLDPDGNTVFVEEIVRYIGIGGVFGDVDGDGQTEFVAVTQSGVNVLKPGRTRRTAALASKLGIRPCRVWLKDLDEDGVPELYIGGAGTSPACYDVNSVKLSWTLLATPVHIRDAAMVDADEDGKPEMVAGGADGFLYVIRLDGSLAFSKCIGESVVSIAALDGCRLARLAVGLEDGRLLLLDDQLDVSASARIGNRPVTHLALIGSAGRKELIAADESGDAISVPAD